MKKTEIANDAGSVLGVVFVLVGLYLFWPPVMFVTAGIVVLTTTGAINLPTVPRRGDEQ